MKRELEQDPESPLGLNPEPDLYLREKEKEKWKHELAQDPDSPPQPKQDPD